MFQLIAIFIMAGLMTGLPCQDTTNISEGDEPDLNTCWTEWFDRDDPSVTGDWELLTLLRRENPGKICHTPVGIEVETTAGLSMAAAGEVIALAEGCSGFICLNAHQPDRRCLDYRVRFVCQRPFCNQHICWSKWFDRDDPSGSGDNERLSDLRKEYPGSICHEPRFIEAVTVYGMTPALVTGQNFFTFNPTTGFVCRNSDQTHHPHRRCHDYKVRFGCWCNPPIFNTPLSLSLTVSEPR